MGNFQVVGAQHPPLSLMAQTAGEFGSTRPWGFSASYEYVKDQRGNAHFGLAVTMRRLSEVTEFCDATQVQHRGLETFPMPYFG